MLIRMPYYEPPMLTYCIMTVHDMITHGPIGLTQIEQIYACPENIAAMAHLDQWI